MRIIPSRSYRPLPEFCPCPRLIIRQFGQAFATYLQLYRQGLGKKVVARSGGDSCNHSEGIEDSQPIGRIRSSSNATSKPCFKIKVP
jgi:hypothetical protein